MLSYKCKFFVTVGVHICLKTKTKIKKFKYRKVNIITLDHYRITREYLIIYNHLKCCIKFHECKSSKLRSFPSQSLHESVPEIINNDIDRETFTLYLYN